MIIGIALVADEEIRGSSNITKLFTEEALRNSVESLENCAITNGSMQTVNSVCGEVVDAKFMPDYRLIYKAKIYDDAAAEKLDEGTVDIVPRMIHNVTNSTKGVTRITEIEFDNLFLAPETTHEDIGIL